MNILMEVLMKAVASQILLEAPLEIFVLILLEVTVQI